MIQTKEFEITKGEYFKIVLLLQLRNLWWFFLLIIIISLIAYSDLENSVSLFVFIFTLLYFPLYIFLIYRSAYSDQNKFMLSSRFLKITNRKISATFQDSTYPEDFIISEYPLGSIINKIRFKNYWLLKAAKTNYIIIPVSAFFNEEEKKVFENIIEKIPFAGSIQ